MGGSAYLKKTADLLGISCRTFNHVCRKNLMNDNSLGGSRLLLKEVEGKWQDCLKLI